MRIWRRKDHTIRFQSKPHSQTIHAVAYDPMGRTVVSGCDDGILRSFAAANGTQLSKARGNGAILAVCYASDGESVFFGTDTGVWRATVRTGEVIERRHCDSQITSLRLSACSRVLIAGSKNGAVHIWRLSAIDAAPRTIRDAGNSVCSLGVLPAGRLLATGDCAGTLCVVDLRLGTMVAKRKDAHRGSMNGVGFLCAKNLLLSAGADARLKTWKIESSNR